MRTLNVEISESDFAKYNLNSEHLSFSDLVQKIRADIAKGALRQAQEMAREAGLSEMGLEEINAEIAAVRGAKSNS